MTVDRRWVIGVGAAAVTVAVGGALRWWWRARPHPNPSKLAIAVLPFDDISPGGVEQPIADGLAGEVIGVLTRHKQVRVSAASSAFQFRHTALPLGEVGRQLGVTHVLDGTVFRTKEQVRLTVRLRAVADEEVVWHDAFQEPAEAMSGLPLRVAQGALEALHAPATGALPPAPSARAFELYLSGRHFMQARTQESIRKARDYFQRAVDTDPSFALGYTALAHSWIAEYQYGSGLTVRDMDARAQPLLDRAFTLQPRAPGSAGDAGALEDEPQPRRRGPTFSRAAPSRHSRRARPPTSGSASTRPTTDFRGRRWRVTGARWSSTHFSSWCTRAPGWSRSMLGLYEEAAVTTPGPSSWHRSIRTPTGGQG